MRRHILLIVVILLFQQGCLLPKLKLSFGGLLPHTRLGDPVDIGLAFRNTDATFEPSVLKVSGSIVSLENPAPLPSKLRFVITHKDASGNQLASGSFDTDLNSDGTIPRQSFTVPGILLNEDETVVVSLIPVDTDLPFCRINLKIRVRKTA